MCEKDLEVNGKNGQSVWMDEKKKQIFKKCVNDKLERKRQVELALYQRSEFDYFLGFKQRSIMISWFRFEIIFVKKMNMAHHRSVPCQFIWTRKWEIRSTGPKQMNKPRYDFGLMCEQRFFFFSILNLYSSKVCNFINRDHFCLSVTKEG